MFRNISNRILSRRSHPTFTRKNGTVQEPHKIAMEINAVKLMGTIQNEVKRLKNGTINLYLKTMNEGDSKYCIHKVTIANRELLKMVGWTLKVNDRIYIGGKMKTENDRIQNLWHHNVEIMANELYYIDPNPEITDIEKQEEIPPFDIDGNDVELLAFIVTDVRNERNLSSFSVVTHFTRFKGKPNESVSHEIHRVLIYNDPELIPIARNLRKQDRVYITGSILYSQRQYPDGNVYASGYVKPSNLLKLKPLPRDEP